MAIVLDGSNLTTTGVLNSKTAVASTSGTSIDFTGIPAGTKRITVMFGGVSTSGTSQKLIQLGSGSAATTGYLGSGAGVDGAPAASNSTAGLIIDSTAAAELVHGIATICNLTGNLWVLTVVSGVSGNNQAQLGGASVTLAGTLDRVRITTVNGTDTFDAGSINILYE
jgi:hypothetical protein